ncbi:hypothetical protein PIGHUM_02545 [Pigmentiphaga humi]|uniref:Transmembrane protein n=1 Tax=Pigmentiphaga humi TaxID=2478468 RepID=A0A3P4B2H0_9BURK|nr:hypothetical protein [Pigmentiphaga humi]VCU70473.1 hypothetical protein PIGHUM_02545 [Pigmentiphaga humi]
MESTRTVGNPYPAAPAPYVESPRSGVSWAAIFAGAVVAAAMFLMLLAGGSGLGFVSMSPWRGEGASAMALGIGAIIWMIATHIVSFGLGGYIAGRLRTKWVGIHTDEVFFRDTAHGLLVWALSAVVSAVVLGSAVTSVASGTAKAGATVAAGAGAAAAGAVAGSASPDTMRASSQYFVDTLLRSEQPAPSDRNAARMELGRIMAVSLARGELSQEDRTYAARVVSAQAGIDEATAQQRIDATVARAKQAAEQAEQKAREAADAARKAAAGFALWAFASMLIGAFVASWMATVGGRGRDAVV